MTKIGIIGPNGIGKTTFVKTILGDILPLSGSLKFLKEYKIGYFDQNLATLNTINHGHRVDSFPLSNEDFA
ncbi:MAG: ATP-binding cassette domain-containing protein [Bacillus subtilis]|nr:ATP-binding cassette domain-containing protein [Bacillus subtilis]